jgi:hypothetical protein
MLLQMLPVYKDEPFFSTSSTQPTEFDVPDRIIAILYSSTMVSISLLTLSVLPPSYDFQLFSIFSMPPPSPLDP